MKYNQNFVNYLTAIARHDGNKNLCEAIHTAYKAYCEAVDSDELAAPDGTFGTVDESFLSAQKVKAENSLRVNVLNIMGPFKEGKDYVIKCNTTVDSQNDGHPSYYCFDVAMCLPNGIELMTFQVDIGDAGYERINGEPTSNETNMRMLASAAAGHLMREAEYGKAASNELAECPTYISSTGGSKDGSVHAKEEKARFLVYWLIQKFTDIDKYSIDMICRTPNSDSDVVYVTISSRDNRSGGTVKVNVVDETLNGMPVHNEYGRRHIKELADDLSEKLNPRRAWLSKMFPEPHGTQNIFR